MKGVSVPHHPFPGGTSGARTKHAGWLTMGCQRCPVALPTFKEAPWGGWMRDGILDRSDSGESNQIA